MSGRAEKWMGEMSKSEAFLIIISVIYIGYFVSLNYFYDWDTMDYAIKLNGNTFSPHGSGVHFLVPILSGILVTLGFEPLNALRVLTAVFMLVLVLGAYKLTYDESKNRSLALLMGLFILFNFGFTFLSTSLEDNVWMYGLIMPFALFLLRERWVISAFLLSTSILVHIQAEVFIPMFFGYIILKLKLLDFLRHDDGPIKGLKEAISTAQMREFTSALIAFLAPLSAAYAYLVLLKGWTLSSFFTLFTASQSFLHGDSNLVYFTSDNSIFDQLRFAYYGYISTFVCSYPASRGFISTFSYRHPDHLPSEGFAFILGGVLALLIIYVLVKSFTPNLKILCAMPTFLVLFFHAMVYESWCVERWDFMPFFVMYFVAVGYSAQANKTKERLKLVLAIIVMLSATFTFVSFYAITGFQESPMCAYGDELGNLLDDQSIALDMTIYSGHSYGRYLTYKCGDKIVFPTTNEDLAKCFTKTNLYTSYATYSNLQKANPNVKLEMYEVWSNDIDNNLGIVRLWVRAI